MVGSSSWKIQSLRPNAPLTALCALESLLTSAVNQHCPALRLGHRRQRENHQYWPCLYLEFWDFAHRYFLHYFWLFKILITDFLWLGGSSPLILHSRQVPRSPHLVLAMSWISQFYLPEILIVLTYFKNIFPSNCIFEKKAMNGNCVLKCEQNTWLMVSAQKRKSDYNYHILPCFIIICKLCSSSLQMLLKTCKFLEAEFGLLSLHFSVAV